MTGEFANQIYDVLVEVCGAREDERAMFIYHHTKPQPTTEFRFAGSLGFGGKFYSRHGFYVSCYPEDLTAERGKTINNANLQLANIAQRQGRTGREGNK